MGTSELNSTTFFASFFGGDKRDRTADLLHAMQALSQLSYTPQNTLARLTSYELQRAFNYSHKSLRLAN